MQKTCSRCQTTKPLNFFNHRAASPDGYAAACAACIREQKQVDYWSDPAERAKTIARAIENKRARFEADPAYKRAFNLWGSTKKRRTKIPPWAAIEDFVPACKKALKLGPEYEIDHIIPLCHPRVCGLHVANNVRVVKRSTNQRKGNSFQGSW